MDSAAHIQGRSFSCTCQSSLGMPSKLSPEVCFTNLLGVFQYKQGANHDKPSHSELLTRLAFGVGWVFVSWDLACTRQEVQHSCCLSTDHRQSTMTLCHRDDKNATHFQTPLPSAHYDSLGKENVGEDMKDQETCRLGRHMKDRQKWGKEGKEA